MKEIEVVTKGLTPFVVSFAGLTTVIKKLKVLVFFE